MLRLSACRTLLGVIALLLIMGICPARATAAPFLLKFNFTMPAGIDPDRKIFFAFNGDSDTFTGNDLIDGVPGVEFHSVFGSGLQVNSVLLSLDSPVPACIDPLTGQVTSLIDTLEFPSVAVPWQSIPPSPFPLVLSDQPGAVRIREPIISSFFGLGLAYGVLDLTPAGRADVLSLDPACLDDFRQLRIRATGFGFVVPEPGGIETAFSVLALSGVILCRLRRR